MRLIFTLASLIPLLVFAEPDKDSQGSPTLTPEELEDYQFNRLRDGRSEPPPPVVKDLNVGQKFILDAHRQGTKDLMTRRLGIVTLKQDESDLRKIQQMVDRKIIGQSDVEQWQALGVVFGDVLVAELGLHWVSYKDELGLSKALRWKKTENYVFPVTMLSRRVQYKQEVNVSALFEQIKQDIVEFARYEELHERI